MEGTGKLSAALPIDLTITIKLTKPAASRPIGLEAPSLVVDRLSSSLLAGISQRASNGAIKQQHNLGMMGVDGDLILSY